MPSFPALTESRAARRVAFVALYLAQGIGVGPFFYALSPYFAERGMTPAFIGTFVGIVVLPWSLKLVAGPVMDRWTFLPMGRRRPWILFAQAGVVLSFAAVAIVPDPLDHLTLVMIGGVAVNTFLAFQDVAIDGMAVDVLPVEEQVNANALMFGSQAIGVAGSVASAAWLLSTFGISVTFAVNALVFCGFILVPLLLRERPGERLLPWSEGAPSAAALAQRLSGWRQIGQSLGRGVALPASLLAIAALLVYRTGYGVILAVMPVLTVQQLGWGDTDYSQLKATADFVGAVACMSLGGLLARWLGSLTLLKLTGACLSALLVTMGMAGSFWTSGWATSGFVALFTTFNTMLMVLFGAMMMSLCWKRVAATQFGIYMAIGNVGLSVGSALLGPLTGALSFAQIFVVTAGAYAFMVAAMHLVNRERHTARVDALEQRERPGEAPPGAPPDFAHV